MTSRENSRFAEECREDPLALQAYEVDVYSKSTASKPLDCEKDIYLGFFFDGTNNSNINPTQMLVQDATQSTTIIPAESAA